MSTTGSTQLRWPACSPPRLAALLSACPVSVAEAGQAFLCARPSVVVCDSPCWRSCSAPRLFFRRFMVVRAPRLCCSFFVSRCPDLCFAALVPLCRRGFAFMPYSPGRHGVIAWRLRRRRPAFAGHSFCRCVVFILTVCGFCREACPLRWAIWAEFIGWYRIL